MSDVFVESVQVLDEWAWYGDKYRLVSFGQGPDRVQEWECDTGWHNQPKRYTCDTLVARLLELKHANTPIEEA